MASSGIDKLPLFPLIGGHSGPIRLRNVEKIDM